MVTLEDQEVRVAAHQTFGARRDGQADDRQILGIAARVRRNGDGPIENAAFPEIGEDLPNDRRGDADLLAEFLLDLSQYMVAGDDLMILQANLEQRMAQSVRRERRDEYVGVEDDPH